MKFRFTEIINYNGCKANSQVVLETKHNACKTLKWWRNHFTVDYTVSQM